MYICSYNYDYDYNYCYDVLSANWLTAICCLPYPARSLLRLGLHHAEQRGHGEARRLLNGL